MRLHSTFSWHETSGLAFTRIRTSPSDQFGSDHFFCLSVLDTLVIGLAFGLISCLFYHDMCQMSSSDDPAPKAMDSSPSKEQEGKEGDGPSDPETKSGGDEMMEAEEAATDGGGAGKEQPKRRRSRSLDSGGRRSRLASPLWSSMSYIRPSGAFEEPHSQVFHAVTCRGHRGCPSTVADGSSSCAHADGQVVEPTTTTGKVEERGQAGEEQRQAGEEQEQGQEGKEEVQLS